MDELGTHMRRHEDLGEAGARPAASRSASPRGASARALATCRGVPARDDGSGRRRRGQSPVCDDGLRRAAHSGSRALGRARSRDRVLLTVDGRTASPWRPSRRSRWPHGSRRCPAATRRSSAVSRRIRSFRRPVDRAPSNGPPPTAPAWGVRWAVLWNSLGVSCRSRPPRRRRPAAPRRRRRHHDCFSRSASRAASRPSAVAGERRRNAVTRLCRAGPCGCRPQTASGRPTAHVGRVGALPVGRAVTPPTQHPQPPRRRSASPPGRVPCVLLFRCHRAP